jgi:hypothetical protein
MRMRKFVMALFVLAGAAVCHAQSLIQPANLIYLGAFRLPRNTFLLASELPMALDAARSSLFVARGPIGEGYGYAPAIMEIGIPTPVNSHDLTVLPIAATLQDAMDPTEGHIYDAAPLTGTACSSAVWSYRARRSSVRRTSTTAMGR